MRLFILAGVIAGLAFARAAAAETVRMAVVIGHNVGSGKRPPLRYAEQDAERMAGVLVELGGLRKEEVTLLRGPDVATVRTSLDRVISRVTAHGADPAKKVVLIFYYSGHSDGQAFELGGERLGFAELRTRLRASGAAVRLAIIDSCRSGAILRTKSGRLAPSFDIRFANDLASTGEAVLTSSSEHEPALESQDIRGSFFSHHLISGLRGAADTSGDGRVTLGEAYNYAFINTISATYGSLSGSQHPEYQYGLSGQGELVLTEVARRSAGLELPADFDRMLVQDEASGLLVAEVGSGAARRIAVPPGRYRVVGVRETRMFGAQINLGHQEQRVLEKGDLSEAPISPTLAKGEPAALLAAAALGLPGRRLRDVVPVFWLAGGAGAGVARVGGQRTTAALGLRERMAGGWEATLALQTGAGDGFREHASFLLGGYGVGASAGPFFARAALRLGGGVALQVVADQPQTPANDARTLWSPAAVAAASLGGGVFLGDRFALTLEGNLPGAVLRRDGDTQLVTLPSALLGLALTLP